MDFQTVVREAKSRYTAGAGLVNGVFNFFCGRSTFFAILFTTVGIVQELRGKLSGNFVLLIGAIQGLIVAHSWKEDWHEQQKAMADQIANVAAVQSPTNSPRPSSS